MTQDAAALRDLIKMAVDAYETAAATRESSARAVDRERGATRDAIAAQRTAGRLTPAEDVADLAAEVRDQATTLLERASLAHLRGASSGRGMVVPGVRSATEEEAAAAFASAQIAAAELRVALLFLARAKLAAEHVAEASVLADLIAAADPSPQVAAELADLRAAIRSKLRTARLTAASADLDAGRPEAAQAAVLEWLREHGDDPDFHKLLVGSSKALVDAAKSSDIIATVVSAQAEALRRFGLVQEARALSRHAPTVGWLAGGARTSVYEFGGHAAQIVDVAFVDQETLVSIDGAEAKTWSLTGQGAGHLVRTIAMRGAFGLSSDGRFACGGVQVWAVQDGGNHATDGPAGPATTFFDSSVLSDDGSVLVIPTSSETIQAAVRRDGSKEPYVTDQNPLALVALAVHDLKTVRGKKTRTELGQATQIQGYPQSRLYTFKVQICNGIQIRGLESGYARGWHAALSLPGKAVWVDVATSFARGVVAVMSNDGTVWIISTSNMQVTHTLAITRAKDLDGMLRVSHSGQVVVGSSSGTVTAWDVPSGKVVCSVAALDPPPTVVAVSPDDQVIAVGAASGLVRIVDIATGTVRSQWQAHNGQVLSLVFSPDSSMIASGGADRVVRVWRAES